MAERDSLISSLISSQSCAASIGVSSMQLDKPELHGVARAQFRALIAELNRSRSMRCVPPEHLDNIFNTLDDNGDGVLGCDEFLDLAVDSLNLYYARYIERTLPGIWATFSFSRVKAWTEESGIGGRPQLMNILMFANTCVIVTQSLLDQYRCGDVY